MTDHPTLSLSVQRAQQRRADGTEQPADDDLEGKLRRSVAIASAGKRKPLSMLSASELTVQRRAFDAEIAARLEALRAAREQLDKDIALLERAGEP